MNLVTSSSGKERLDILLVKRGIVSSRSRAQGLVLAGEVLVDGKVITKSGTPVKEDALIEIKQPIEYVSRGGLKLEKAIKEFSVEVGGKVCIDIGASTGGFTHCLLKHGAKFVYAIDVGKGLLHPLLVKNPRVKSIEGYNARYLESHIFTIKPVFGVIDVSFISVRKILPALYRCLEGDREVIILIKPQFEAEYKFVSRGGIVVKPEFHIETIKKVLESTLELGFSTHGLTFSPIRGKSGNIEYLLYISSRKSSLEPPIEEIVKEAFSYFENRNTPPST
ncbi:MAG: TlyA family RNA methyltransferase [bacterium]